MICGLTRFIAVVVAQKHSGDQLLYNDSAVLHL